MSTRLITPTISLIPATISRAHAPSKSRHFFAAFQRYVSVTASSRSPLPLHAHTHSHARPRPTSYHQKPGPLYPRLTSTTFTLKPPKQTHYTLFPATLPTGPPPAGPFTVNLPSLKREFLQLQSLAHPDRHSGPNKARAEGLSATINEAYKILSSPLLRAQYLLHLNGINVAEDETAKVEDEGLLMAVLEAREVIEGAQEEGELEGVRGENESRIQRSEEVLAGLCERGDWEGVKEEAVRLRYWVNIREALQGWEKGKPVVIHH